MTDKEIATLEKKVTRAKNLQEYIEDTEKRIEVIQSEISYNPNGIRLNLLILEKNQFQNFHTKR